MRIEEKERLGDASMGSVTDFEQEGRKIPSTREERLSVQPGKQSDFLLLMCVVCGMMCIPARIATVRRFAGPTTIASLRKPDKSSLCSSNRVTFSQLAV